MAEYRALDVAMWFVSKFCEHGDLVTHLKVQKLLYYAEAWTQTICNEPLFIEDIQAWAHGPVVPEVFHAFKEYGWHPLPAPEVIPSFDANILDVLEQVYDIYGEFSAKNLENMTHLDSPWIDARKGLSEEARCENVIPKEEIKKYFIAKYGDDLDG